MTLLDFIHVRNLSAADISAKNYGPILNSIIMSKLLHHHLKSDISKQMTGKWDIAKLLHILKHEIVPRERCEQFKGI